MLSLLAGCSENTAKPTETNTKTESTEKTTTTALALHNYEDTNVDFETVWGQGHVEAERTGDSSANFYIMNDTL